MTDRRAPARRRVEVCVTADEVLTALESAFLAAGSEIWASFPVLDLDMRLRTPAARAVGQTWFDLLLHTLRRGVAVTFVIADVDPLTRQDQHRQCWRAMRMCLAAGELAGPAARLTVRTAMHPARSGLVTRLLRWPGLMRLLHRSATAMADLSDAARSAALRDVPGLASALRTGAGGRLRPRLGCLPQGYPALHNQKLAVFDRRRLVIGGLGPAAMAGGPRPPGDRAAGDVPDVLWIMEGPVAAEAQAHLQSFGALTEGQDTPAQARFLLRTLSRRRAHGVPGRVISPVLQDIAKGYETLIRRAGRLIYLETGCLCDPQMTTALCEAARQVPVLTCILILPGDALRTARGNMDRRDARQQARCLRHLTEAFADRIFVGCPAPVAHAGGATPPPKPARLATFDDGAALLASADLSTRGLRRDTEAGAYLTSEADVSLLRRRVMGRWLPPDADQSCFDMQTAVAAWARLATDRAKAAQGAGAGHILPYFPDSPVLSSRH